MSCSDLFAEAKRLEADKAECDRVNMESMAHIQRLETQLRFMRLEAGNHKAALAVANEHISVLEIERARDAQAFAYPGARIANLEHELADLRESETAQATRIDRLIAELHVATAEMAKLRDRLESRVRTDRGPSWAPQACVDAIACPQCGAGPGFRCDTDRPLHVARWDAWSTAEFQETKP